MKKVSLSGEPRAHVGKKDAATLRSEGRVPAVLYGGERQVHFHVDNIQLGKIVRNPEVFQIDLELDSTVHKCIIQDVQFHPVTDEIVHIDFLEVFDNKPIVVELPVRTKGSSIGILNGGQLSMVFRKVRMRGLLEDLPEFIEVDIANLDIGDKIRVGDIDVTGCTLLQPESAVVAAIRRTRAAVSAGSLLDDEGEEGEEGAEGSEEGGSEESAE